MRTVILFCGAIVAGCASQPEVVVKGDSIPLNAAPAPSELKVEHHRFQDDVIPGAYVDRSGYTPTILIADPAERVPAPSGKKAAEASLHSKRAVDSGPVLNGQGSDGQGLASGSQSAATQICESEKTDCVLAELFFGLDQSELTNVGRAIIQNIDVAGKSLELIGYADAVGEHDYNGQLALARARNVRSALLESGAREVVVRAGHEAKFAGPKFRKVIIVGL